MPALKSTAAARSRSRDSQQRAWGTRYDTLLNTTEPSQDVSSLTASAISSSPSAANELSRDLGSLSSRADPGSDTIPGSAQPERKRDWADDEVPQMLGTPNASFFDQPSQSRSEYTSTLACATAIDSPRRDTNKLPHNASVFVGSLPSDVDETELSQQLRDRLAQFARILSIKIIHDAKGGVCAFLQCEDAVQASRIVTRTQQVPQIFMGRQLRFELARAFRSLWISYRKPMQFIPSSADENEEDAEDMSVDENGTPGRWAETPLPDTMRIWRPRAARFPVVSYQMEARRANIPSRPVIEQSPIDAFDLGGLLLTGLKFDERTLKTIVEAFGPLESFKPYVADDDSQSNINNYPSGHNSPRSEVMDFRVWEVKWEHRDDCISALSTLRWVPHLAVTWASLQQTGYHPRTPRQVMSRQGYLQSPIPASPSFQQSLQAKCSPAPHSRPTYFQDRMSMVRDSPDSPASSGFARSPVYNGSPNILPLSPSLGRRGNDAVRRSRIVNSKNSDYGDSEDGWMVVRPQNITHTILSSVAGMGPSNESPFPGPIERSRHSADATDGQAKAELRSPKWNEGDFPPLMSPTNNSYGLPTETSKIEELDDIATSNEPSESDESSRDIVNDLPSIETSNSSIPRPFFSHRRSISNPIDVFSSTSVKIMPDGQTLEIPPTPELSGACFTETPTSAMPRTPIYPPMIGLGNAQYRNVEGCGIEIFNDNGFNASGFHEREKEFDPKTIFVGGLEPYGPVPWDENRLKTVFQQYGEVENVRIVNQSGKKTSFAFVTFTDESAPMKAIREEHDRNYDGRLIRVQMRELNPTRGGYRYRGRGVGRVRRHGFGQHGDASQRSDFNIYYNNAKDVQGTSNTTHSVRGPGNEWAGMPFLPNLSVYPHLVTSSSHGTDSATLISSNSYDIPEAESQDSDLKTAVSVTPPPTVLSSSASNVNVMNPTTPQSLPPTVLGYVPHPWATAYGAHMPYHMPLSTTIPMGVPPMMGVGDTNAALGNQTVPMNSMSRAPFPYPPYAYVPVLASDSSHSSSSSQPSTPARGQPPLHATGFIQGEHGTLIPVYQQEALNEYMSGSSPRVPMHPQGSFPIQFQGVQSQGAVSAAPPWHNYPPHPQFYAYAMPQSVSIVPSSSPPACAQQQMQHDLQGRIMQPAHTAPWSMLNQSPTSHLARRMPIPPHASAATDIQHHGHSYQNSTHANGGLHQMHSLGATYHNNRNYHQQRREHNGFRQGRNTYDFDARSRDSGMSSDMNSRPNTQQSNVGPTFMNMHRQGRLPLQ